MMAGGCDGEGAKRLGSGVGPSAAIDPARQCRAPPVKRTALDRRPRTASSWPTEITFAPARLTSVRTLRSSVATMTGCRTSSRLTNSIITSSASTSEGENSTLIRPLTAGGGCSQPPSSTPSNTSSTDAPVLETSSASASTKRRRCSGNSSSGHEVRVTLYPSTTSRTPGTRTKCSAACTDSSNTAGGKVTGVLRDRVPNRNAVCRRRPPEPPRLGSDGSGTRAPGVDDACCGSVRRPPGSGRAPGAVSDPPRATVASPSADARSKAAAAARPTASATDSRVDSASELAFSAAAAEPASSSWRRAAWARQVSRSAPVATASRAWRRPGPKQGPRSERPRSSSRARRRATCD